MRNVLLGLTVVLSGVLCAQEIVFTGADESNPTNLSSAANWSVAPSADAIGVIDLSKTTATKYLVEGAAFLQSAAIEVIDRNPNDSALPDRMRNHARELLCR